MRWSLRLQLLVPLVTLLLGVVAMSLWAALASAHHARDQINHQVRQIVRTLNRTSFPIDRALPLMKGFSGAEYLLVDKDGKRETTLPRPLRAPLAPAAEGQDLDALELDQQVEIDGESFLYTGVTLHQGRYAGATLYIFYPESLWREAVWQAVRPSLIFGILAGLAAIVFTVFLAQRLTRRVQELERQTRSIAAGDFSPMPLPRRNDELRDLAQSVNRMAERLAALQETIRKNERMRLLGQVSGGLAHQLRNGVTGARLAVQLHARECRSGADPEPLDVALRQLALVEMHLKRFLALGRAEPAEQVVCTLPRLLEEDVALLQPQCRHAHVELRLRPAAVPNDIAVRGNPEQLSQLFLNILTNAIEAAGPGGSVDVRTDVKDGRALVRVSDSGPGPPPQVAAQLFEPFVTGKPDGIGLGLAVAREIAHGHGGEIRWERDGGRTVFIVELPLEA